MRFLVCGRTNKMQNYSKKLRLYNTKIVIKTIIWQIDNSIYIINSTQREERRTTNVRLSYFFDGIGNSNGSVSGL